MKTIGQIITLTGVAVALSPLLLLVGTFFVSLTCWGSRSGFCENSDQMLNWINPFWTPIIGVMLTVVGLMILKTQRKTQTEVLDTINNPIIKKNDSWLPRILVYGGTILLLLVVFFALFSDEIIALETTLLGFDYLGGWLFVGGLTMIMIGVPVGVIAILLGLIVGILGIKN